MSAADIVTIIVAISTGVVAIIGAMAKMQSNRKKQIAKTDDKVSQIHVLVNGRLEQALKSIAELQAQFAAQGVEIAEPIVPLPMPDD